MLLAPTGFDFMPPGVHILVRVQENKVTVVDIRSQRIRREPPNPGLGRGSV